MLKRSLFLLASLGVVAACTPVDYGFGETTRANIAQQVVDPDPQYEGEIMEGGSGARAVANVRRYNSGQVRQPATSSRGSGATGSGAATPNSSTSGGPQ